MPTVSVNSPNGPLDQIGPYATNQTGPDKDNCDCLEETTCPQTPQQNEVAE